MPCRPRIQPDAPAIDDIRLALNQNQPLGNNRIYAKIERTMGECREAKPRGRPRKEQRRMRLPGQGKLDV
jgi:putative transposase